jgi:chromosome partitioning protein
MTTIGFFNNKGGVGKTSLVFHIAWMLSDLDVRVVVVDLDPQANLTGLFLDEERLESIWNTEDRATVYRALRPVFDREGPQQAPRVEIVGDQIGLLIGDLDLSVLEDQLGQAWSGAMSGQAGDFRLIASFHRLISEACQSHGAKIALVDVGPNLGALNRAALLACDLLVVPVGADFFSLQGLRNMGPTLKRWRHEWRQRQASAPPDFSPPLPLGSMEPLGYVVMRHSVRLDRPVRAFSRWLDRMPEQYATSLRGTTYAPAATAEDDPNCLATLKDYRSLMPMAHEARKAVFHLKVADGAFGGHQAAVQRAYLDFRAVTQRLIEAAQLRELLS